MDAFPHDRSHPQIVMLPEDRKLQDIAMLHRAMRTTPTTSTRHRRWKPAVLVGAGVLVVAAGGAATASALLGPAPATDTVTGRCYTSVSGDFGDDFPGTSVATVSDGPNGPAPTSAIADVVVDDCRVAWRMGVLVRGAPSARPGRDSADLPVPPLVACVLPSGQAAVFPGPSNTCRDLDLAPLKAGR